MGNFICAVIIILALLLFVIINSVMICSICDDIIEFIDKGDTESAERLWSEKKNYISLFVRDAEIDVVTAEAEKLKKAIPPEDAEAETDAFALRDAIIEVKNSEFLNLQGLF